MSAGTISIQNNAAAVAGDGTVFTTELSAGDFIVITTGGVTYTLPVKSIESDTALTLARNYNGPAVTGAAWTAMPRDTLNRISAQIAADTAYAIRQRVLEIDNWYQLLEVNGDVTIKMADGSSYTGPSWLKLIDVMKEMKIDELIPIAEQIRADAQQVADDKPVIVQAKDDALAAAAAAAASQKAAASSEAASASSESAAADSATAAAKSAQEAASHNPVEALVKTSNLSDLTDRDDAWMNVRPTGPTPLAADPVDDLDSATMGWVKRFVASVKSVLQSWSVIKNDISAPTTGTAVKGGEISSVYQIAEAMHLKTSLFADGNYGQRGGAKWRIEDSLGNYQEITFNLGGSIIIPVPATIASVTTDGGDLIVSSKQSPDGTWPTTSPALRALLKNRVPNAGQPGGWFGLNITENVGVDCFGALFLDAAGGNKSWLFAQNGNAISPGSWVPNSDARLKKDKVRVENPLAKMRQIGGYTWTRLDSGAWGIGFLSQEVGAVFPKAVSIGPDRALPDGTIVEGVQSPDSYGISAALHHESILQLMDIVKEAITTIAGVTTDESAKAALEALAERIPAPDTQ
ncbi:tail fiber domain-containing protein [Kluyvera georgiana]|uniref:tail fiber domain-containing protein n=1 Tax=Kluyvera georgiana TaxID=73098 RepID=UPI003AEF2A56